MLRKPHAPVTWEAPINVTNLMLVSALASMTQAQKNTFIARGGGLVWATLPLTAAQLCTASSVPIPFVPAPGVGFVLVPYLFVFSQRLGAATFAAARQYQAEWVGLNTDPLTTVAITNTANVYKRSCRGINNFSTTGPFENVAIQFRSETGDTTLGSGTFQADLLYTIAPVG
jgi:hypothetical protein